MKMAKTPIPPGLSSPAQATARSKEGSPIANAQNASSQYRFRPWSRARSALITWLTVPFVVLTLSQTKAQPGRNSIKRISPEQISVWLVENRVPAVGIGIIEEGVLRQAQVYGKHSSTPESATTIFNVASLTKPVVAMLTLILVSRNQWHLDEPLANYWVDGQVKNDPLHKKLTTRHILSQQSGFTNWRWDHPSKKLTFDSTPGTHFGYSGEGFEYLKRALVAKFGKGLEQLTDSILFKPLAMQDTRFYWKEPVDTSRFAYEYDGQGNRYPTLTRTEASAADDLLTTVCDYGHFGVGVLSRKHFSEQVFQEMIKPQAVVNSSKGLYWGLGWELIKDLSNGEYALFHGGSDRGVRTAVILLPASKRGLIVFTNSDTGGEVIRKIAAHSLDVGKEIVERLK